jgi:hypothetical protein
MTGFRRIVQRVRPTPMRPGLRVTRYRHFNASCSVGKVHALVSPTGYRASSDSVAFVEQITFRISTS